MDLPCKCVIITSLTESQQSVNCSFSVQVSRRRITSFPLLWVVYALDPCILMSKKNQLLCKAFMTSHVVLGKSSLIQSRPTENVTETKDLQETLQEKRHPSILSFSLFLLTDIKKRKKNCTIGVANFKQKDNAAKANASA